MGKKLTDAQVEAFHRDGFIAGAAAHVVEVDEHATVHHGLEEVSA